MERGGRKTLVGVVSFGLALSVRNCGKVETESRDPYVRSKFSTDFLFWET